MYYNTKYREKSYIYILCLFHLRGIHMKEMKKITFMQNNLNRLLYASGPAGCKTANAYSLSVMLDKEIVKYYKNLNQTKC